MRPLPPPRHFFLPSPRAESPDEAEADVPAETMRR